MMMDAVEYFAAVEARLDPPRQLCEADQLFLAEVEKKVRAIKIEHRGYCRSCGTSIPNFAGFCDLCKHIERVSNIRKSQEFGHVCVTCGADISHKGKGAFSCDLCKDKRHKAQQQESNAVRHALERVMV